MRVAILYGLAEGPAHSRRLVIALAQAGLQVTPNIREADMLIAHSGAVLDLPRDLTNKFVVIVAPSYSRPARGLAATMVAKVWQDAHYQIRSGRLHAWAAKSARNFGYSITQQPRALTMRRAIMLTREPLPALNAHCVAVICYRHDPWSALITPEAMASMPPTVLLA